MARPPSPTSTSHRCKQAKDVEMVFLDNANPLKGEQLEDFDALILLAHRFDAGSVPKSGRLAVVARFGVGYDSGGRSGLHCKRHRPRHHA